MFLPHSKIIYRRKPFSQRPVVRYKKIYKIKINIVDKLFAFIKFQTKASFFAYRAFMVIEIQLNIVVLKSKLVPYFALVPYLCFNHLIEVNEQTISNPYFLIKPFDYISVPYDIYMRIQWQYRTAFMPRLIASFFSTYIIKFSKININQVWLLLNYVHLPTCAASLIYDYPSVHLYIAPFRRFTKLYLANTPYISDHYNNSQLYNVYGLLNLKLFEYTLFYR
jgi:hypothetical protein